MYKKTIYIPSSYPIFQPIYLCKRSISYKIGYQGEMEY
jgi:hypothetical protein